MKYKLKRIKSDASFRQFFRAYKGNKTSIIAFTNKDKFKNLEVYSSINKFLKKKGIYTPKLIFYQIDSGLIEIEDLGDNSLLKILNKTKDKLKYYKMCINLLIKLQKINPVENIKCISGKKFKLPKYNLNNLHKESDLFFDWYLKSIIGRKKSFKYKKIIKKELSVIYKKLYFKKYCLVHRDFHVSNIMMSKGKLALIDTQDLIVGNRFYDLVSLLEDVRFKVPKKVKNQALDFYLSKSSIKKKLFPKVKDDYDILAVQRNLKILGIFFRLFKRDNKPLYLKYIPFTWKLIESSLRNKIFDNLRNKIDKAVKKNIRIKTKFK